MTAYIQHLVARRGDPATTPMRLVRQPAEGGSNPPQDDACQAPHWGHVISGEVVVTYTDGKVETCKGDDLSCWPPGHALRVVQDAEVILFSPHREHAHVLDHVSRMMEG